jgi:3-methyladenine DNA glycosylase AlkD
MSTEPPPRWAVDLGATVDAVERRLKGAGTPARATGSRAYLKSTLAFTGTDVPTVRRHVAAWSRAHAGLSIVNVLRVVDALWRRGVFELQLFAAELLALEVDRLTPRHLPRIECLVRQAHTWALVDVLAPRVVGPLLERHGRAVGVALDRWARDDNFWMRRAALLALLLPMRRGEGDWRRFVRYAGALAEDREFFVRKAIGWVLREAATRQPAQVVAFLEPRDGVLSGVTWREAVKKLPASSRRTLERLRQRQRAITR